MNDNIKKMIFVDDEYLYDFESDGVEHSLSYSNTEYWVSRIRDTETIKLIDDGNGYQVIGIEEENRINYSEIERLNIIFQLIQDYKLETGEKTLINGNNNLKNDN